MTTLEASLAELDAEIAVARKADGMPVQPHTCRRRDGRPITSPADGDCFVCAHAEAVR